MDQTTQSQVCYKNFKNIPSKAANGSWVLKSILNGKKLITNGSCWKVKTGF